LISWWDLPWCIGGDFNVTRFPCNRLRASFSPAMEEFSDFILELGLMDIPIWGGSIAWSRNHDSPLWSRIDSFLSLLSGRLIFRTLFSADYPSFFQIIFLFFLIVANCRGAKVTLNLKTCC
jgi:hypothetical protein